LLAELRRGGREPVVEHVGNVNQLRAALGRGADVVVAGAAERGRTERQLLEQRVLLQNIIDSVPCSVFWKDRHCAYLGCNAQSAQDLGLKSPLQIVGKTDYDLQVDRTEADFYVRCDREVMDGGRPLLDIEETQLRPDGKRAVLLTSKVPLRDGCGEVIGVLGVYADITQRKATEEALRASEERHRHLFEHNPCPMFVYDGETLAYLAVNDAALQQYGYSRDEFLRMTLKDIRPPEDVPALLECLAQARPQFERRGVWRHCKKDGTVIEVDIGAHALDFGGRPAWICMALDVTEKRRLEEQLRHSQKLEAIGRLAGGVAHDFNNLLTVIRGYCDILQSELPADGPGPELVGEIRRAQERAAALTRQLLAFSRKQVLAPRVLDLNGVVADVEKMLRRLIGEDVNLTLRLALDLGAVFADPGQVEQVLLNLAVNARDAMPRGGGLTIETRNGDGPGRSVVLAVSDTGCGMSEDVKAHLFEPFFTTKEVGKGTGLGLAVVHGIVEQSGGRIEVDTAPGCGTTFRILLPRVELPTRLNGEADRAGPAPLDRETLDAAR